MPSPLSNVDYNRSLWDRYSADWDKASIRVEDREIADDREGKLRHLGDEWGTLRDVESIVEEYIYPNIPNGGVVVEIGVGGGRIAAKVAPRAGRLYCFDVARNMIERAKIALAGNSNVSFFLLESASLPETLSGQVDFVYSFDVFVHLDLHTIWKYFREIQRVLKPGGRAFLHTTNLAAPGGWARFSKQERYKVEDHYFICPEIVSVLAARADLRVVKSSEVDPSNFYLNRDYLVVLEKPLGESKQPPGKGSNPEPRSDAEGARGGPSSGNGAAATGQSAPRKSANGAPFRRAGPRVTWLLPVKNGMPYLPLALQSIAQQTFKDSTLIAWDNGSSDGTLEELRKWIPSVIPGRIVTGRPDTIGGSLREMVVECDTELCARMDADDISVPERLARQVAFLDENPKVAVVGSQILRINKGGDFVFPDIVQYPTSHADLVASLLTRNPLCHPSVLFRRNAILDSGNYREMLMVEDYDLWFRVAAAGYLLANHPEPLLHYRVHDSSVTQTAYREQRLWALGNDCVFENAPSLFKCSKKTIELLRMRRHPLAIVPISSFVFDVAREHGGNALQMLLSPRVAVGWTSIVTPSDYVSRVFLKVGREVGRALEVGNSH